MIPTSLKLALCGMVFFSLFSSMQAYALWPQPQGVQLFMQIQIRDSDGRLVTYIEGKPQIYDLGKFTQWLDAQSQKNIISKNGKIYEVLRTSYESGFSEANTMGGYFVKAPINGRLEYVMYMDHGSYHVQPGDTIKAYLTLVRQL